MVDEAGYFIRVLLDTGANLSVFNGTEKGLFQYYAKATKTEYCSAINGFGGKTRMMPVYRIPNIRIDGTVIHNVLVVCHIFDMDVDLILAGTLLKMNPFTVRLSKKEMEIQEIGRDVYCVPKDVINDMNVKIIKSTTVFLQEDS
ncbi:MAG: hypothetical protein IK016_01915 [Lachnospiraceae bacterium]|nr:hypothetical protein [Lachnospiraceae bacterium]